jgi:tetratricopeptide (TPR) repeat protein
MPQKSNSREKRLTPQQERDVDIEIGFIEGVVRRDPNYVDALQVLGDNYTRRGRFADGLKVDEQLATLMPADALVQYNLACSCALTDQPERAVAALHRALDLGYSDFNWLRRDPDLRGIRRHPLYRSIRDRIRSMQVKIA